MKKYLLLFIALILLSPKPAKAQEAFSVDVDATYKLEIGGNTHVTHKISIENNQSELYSKDFILKLDNINAKNVIAKEDENDLVVTVTQENGISTIQTFFAKAVVGKDKIRTFTLEFDEPSIASKAGEVWELAIPKLENPKLFRTYNVDLIIPNDFGEKAYMAPTPINSSLVDDGRIYNFSKSQIANSGITAGFGEFQIFTFNLSYHIENTLKKENSISVAIPPDTSTQRISLDDITPKPTKIALDSDGNWLAYFDLAPKERIDVKVVGQAEIFGSPRPYISVSEQTLENSLSSTKYWQVNDPKIKSLAENLKTPEAIYNYVTKALTYDNERAQPNVEREGALSALQNPESAICMEFTDLFVVLSRAAGIPAREINGYAYSVNPDVEPLGLVADVLHSWPEFWDAETKTWIPVDPTWGNTTGGVDYFTKLDMRHLAFVIHGQSDTMPFPPGSYKLGPNPQKDVFVSLGQTPEKKKNDITISAKRNNTYPFLPGSVRVKITNHGPSAEYNLKPSVGHDETILTHKFIEVLLPYSEFEFDSPIPYSVLGTKTPEYLTARVINQSLKIPTFKSLQVVMNLLFLSVLLILAIVALLIKTGRLNLQKLKRKKSSD